MKPETPKQPIKAGLDLVNDKELFFNDHVWGENSILQSFTLDNDDNEVLEWEFTDKELLGLPNLVVKVNEKDEYYIINVYGKSYVAYANPKVTKEKLQNCFIGKPYMSIDKKEIHRFTAAKLNLLLNGKKHVVSGKDVIDIPCGSIPAVQRVVNYPLHPRFLISKDGMETLNQGTSYETLESKRNDKKAGHILQMIYRNLCAYEAIPNATPQEERDILLYKVMCNDYEPEDKDFKFVVNWLAAIVQSPGISLMTNIWFAGSYQGIGKGTLVSLLTSIMGEDRHTILQANTITGNFNAELSGKFILEINEKLPGVSPQQMTNWIKSFSQEVRMPIEGKNMHKVKEYVMLNVIGTAQSVADVFKLEDNDRRNVIFETTPNDTDPNRTRRNHAKKVAVGARKSSSWARAFAFMLERVKVDTKLIETAYTTRNYQVLKAEQASENNIIYFWALAEFTNYTGNISMKDLRDDFMSQNTRSNITQRTFNRLIKELSTVSDIEDFEIIKPQNIPTCKFKDAEGTELTPHQSIADILSRADKDLDPSGISNKFITRGENNE